MYFEPMFSPIDILYIVLSFCALWITLAVFWFIWQAATVLRNINVAVDETRVQISKIEGAISGIRNRFDAMTAPVSLVAEGLKRVVEYVVERRQEKKG
jgi:uncharacterized membrane protein